ncbi:MAG: diaminopimelate epimerase [Desulfobacteraceae bacterium]|nr:diaminopimelate epimerase [Desulfobacteraceae bacterium]
MAATLKGTRFMKMTGTGNDFIIIDNRELKLDKESGRQLARMACRHKLSVGADGLILIEDDPEADFRWLFFNADGSEAEMCGNGARCAARFARLNGIVDKDSITFRTLAGIIEAQILGERRVKVRMTAPHSLKTDISVDLEGRSLDLHFINTGVPHTVHFTQTADQLEGFDIFNVGRSVRYHQRFQPAGTNANFAFVHGPHNITVRTYERGVEDETLACGTGSIATALVAAAKGLVRSPVQMLTRGGETLVIHFDEAPQEGGITKSGVYLEGDARVVYDAQLWDETLRP